MRMLAFTAALMLGTAAMAQTPPADMAPPAGTASDMPAPAPDTSMTAPAMPATPDAGAMPPAATTPTTPSTMAPATASSPMPPAGDPSTYPKCTRKITDRCVNPGGK